MYCDEVNKNLNNFLQINYQIREFVLIYRLKKVREWNRLTISSS